MKGRSSKCLYCGAPIRLEQSVLFSKCDFCGTSFNKTAEIIPSNTIKNLFDRSTSAVSKFVQPIPSKIQEVSQELLKKQTILSKQQINSLNRNRIRVLSKRRNIAILIGVPISLFAFTIINDPFRKELNDQRSYMESRCRNESSRISNTFFARKEYSSCIKDYKKGIREDIKRDKEREKERKKEELKGSKEKAKREKVEKYVTSGEKYFQEKNYKSAIKSINKAIKMVSKDKDIYSRSNFATMYNSRGLAYSSLKEYKLAIKDYTKAIELSPRNAVYIMNRGAVKSKFGKYKLAINDLNKSIKLNANEPSSYNWRGVTYYNLGDFLQAIKDFKKVKQLKPDDPNNLAWLLAVRKKLTDQYKIELEDKSLENVGNSSKDKLNDDGSKPEYEEDFIKEEKRLINEITLSPEPENVFNLFKELADLRGDNNKAKLAIDNYTKAIELKPDYIDAYINRGITKQEMGNQTGACQDWAKASSLGDEDAKEWVNDDCKG